MKKRLITSVDTQRRAVLGQNFTKESTDEILAGNPVGSAVRSDADGR
jgi:hypothetical protein